jgi:hypothetical protein
MRCMQCKQARCCSRACQRGAWKQHKSKCEPPVGEKKPRRR